MHSNLKSPDSNNLDCTQSPPACYFSIVPSSSSHFSVETPSTTPVSEYSSDIFADPLNPLLAFRPLQMEHMSSTIDSSRLLQLQTAAAHARPVAQPLQHSNSTSSSTSNSTMSSHSNSPSPQFLCCCRCRRESSGHSGMVQFGTNLYYCNHCARMTGYCAG